MSAWTGRSSDKTHALNARLAPEGEVEAFSHLG